MSSLRAQLASIATAKVFKLAWWGVRALPERAAYTLFDKLSDASFRRGGKSVERMRSNYALLRPELSTAELDDLTRKGMQSYMRYWCDAFRLPGLSREQIRASVTTTGIIDDVRAKLAAGESIVLFLGHLGNWDLAGAWSATELAHVTTVAEKLEPAELFEAFLSFRESLGMTIIGLERGKDVLGQVAAALEKPGGFAPLLSDRDLTSRGVTVRLADHEARVAAGPAALAHRTGAALVPVSITYGDQLPSGRHGIVIHFHEEVAVQHTDDLRADVAAATQECVDALATTLRTKTEDWHMMQRVFVQDLTATRSSR